jgi:type IV pilus assembly protein PilW
MGQGMNRRRGFTLIELSVAIVIASFVVIGLYGVFTVQTHQLRTQTMRMEMHQNGRFAMEVITRSLRMAGYGSSNGVVYGALGNGGEGNALPVIIPDDDYDGTGPDAVTVTYMEPALVMNSSASTLEACSTSTITFSSSFLDYGDRLLQFKSGDLLMCLDYAAIGAPESYLWPITSDAATATSFGAIDVSSDVASISDFSEVCGSSENLSPVMRCSKGQVLTFYIDLEDDGVGPGSEKHPVLMMDLNDNFPSNDDIPLVDNIEDLQIEYCVDDGTDTVSCNMMNQWDDDFSTGDIEDVWQARVSMVVRSNKPDYKGVHSSTRPAVANRGAESSSDHYYREVISSEVTVRNLRMLSAD